MGYSFEGRYAYDDSGNAYRLDVEGVKPSDLGMFAASLWYKGLAEEAERCIELVNRKGEWQGAGRTLKATSKGSIVEEHGSGVHSAYISPFSSSSVFTSPDIREIHIGYCHNVTISCIMLDTKNMSVKGKTMPIRVDFGRFYRADIEFDNVLFSLSDADRHVVGSLYVRGAVIQEYEEGKPVPFIKNRIRIHRMTTHRGTVDLPLIYGYSDILQAKMIYTYHTKKLEGFRWFLDNIIKAEGKLMQLNGMYVNEVKDIDGVYGSVMQELDFVEEIKPSNVGSVVIEYKDITKSDDGFDSYKGIRYVPVMLINCDGYDRGVKTGIYSYKGRHFMFLIERNVTCLQVEVL